ncbi:YhbP family protein [Serratia marcescens]|uniref:YhbP family protein n=1 Tax=Serratia marcescens TaxID=615 RepID=UPI00143E834F|nr:YhbP family protein [Serratia marcescens]MBH2602471.1 YhbP family protein [Serratia marcescens]MBH2890424.1 YhbP family protein [Serratia marcescens]MBN5392060.1 YhbP family protein [Serratia marcescens]QIX79333.1 YhbP family protein [Serratia marcescens]HDT6550125.1 YhbP family protein [Serratia marcescens]
MNTPEQRQQIADFIGKQHVLTLCAGDGLDMWCANCFYVFDAATMALWLMTEPHTRHGGLMLNNGRVVGTIAPKPKSIALIRGVQYRAEAMLLSGEEAEAARARYCKRFPIARAMKASVWRLDLHEVKMTDNTLGFGKKLHWARSIL